jgi:hypothetical protein
VLVLVATAYTALPTLIVAADGPDSGLKRTLGRDLKGKLSFTSYLITIPLAMVWRGGSIGIMVAISIAWLIPDRRIEHYIKSVAVRKRFAK